MSRIMVMAGGTGGHVMPALAVAECLRERGVEVLWLGTGNGLEAKLAPRAGFEFKTIHIKGVRRSGVARIASMPFRLAWAMLQALWIILWRRPDGVLGMGGFVSGPGGLVAGLTRTAAGAARAKRDRRADQPSSGALCRAGAERFPGRRRHRQSYPGRQPGAPRNHRHPGPRKTPGGAPRAHCGCW